MDGLLFAISLLWCGVEDAKQKKNRKKAFREAQARVERVRREREALIREDEERKRNYYKRFYGK